MGCGVLAVLNNEFRPPIAIQNGRNKQTFDTYAFNIDIVPLVLEEICFAGHTFEYKWKTKQKAQFGKHNAEMRNGKNGEARLHNKTWVEHRCGRGPGPATSPPSKGGG